MIAHFCHLLLLAQAEAPAGAPAQGQQAPTGGGPQLLLMIFVTGILFYFIMLRPQKNREKALRERINNLKENERVVTIGGIHGVVTNVQRDAERVTIRVDEATGTKLRVSMSAIARVVSDEEEQAAASGTKS